MWREEGDRKIVSIVHISEPMSGRYSVKIYISKDISNKGGANHSLWGQIWFNVCFCMAYNIKMILTFN